MATNSNTIAGALEAYKKEHLDSNFRATPLIDHWKRVGGIKKESGRSLSCNLMLDEVTQATDIIAGTERFPLVNTRPFATATFQWSRVGFDILVTGKDKDETSGQAAIFNLAQEYLINAHETALRALNAKLVANTGGAFSALTSLYGASSSGQSTGVFEELAFGSQTNLVGGVNKASWLTQFQHQRGDVNDAWGTNGRKVLNKVIRDCRNRTPGGGMPDLILMSDDAFTNLEGTLDSNERYADAGKMRSTGAISLMFKGIPVEYEPLMPAGDGTEFEEFSAYVLNLRKSLTLNHTPGGWFELSKWVDMLPGGIDAEGCKLVLDVALGVSHLPSVGVVVDGDTA